MPCSFALGDGLSFAVTTSAETKKKADDAACRSVLANLLMRDASAVILRQKHWSCSIADLVHRIGEILQQQHQPLAVPPRRGSNYQAPIAGEGTQREQDILQVLRSCCQFGTVCDPSNLHTPPGDRKPWLELDRLLPRGGLLPFLTAHAEEFEVTHLRAPGFGSGSTFTFHKRVMDQALQDQALPVPGHGPGPGRGPARPWEQHCTAAPADQVPGDRPPLALVLQQLESRHSLSAMSAHAMAVANAHESCEKEEQDEPKPAPASQEPALGSSQAPLAAPVPMAAPAAEPEPAPASQEQALGSSQAPLGPSLSYSRMESKPQQVELQWTRDSREWKDKP